MIELLKLRKEFHELAAVADLNLAIPQGEIYGLIGPNGAGKTTTIRMICGLLAPTEGTIRIANIDVLREPKGAQKHIGYLSDFFAVYEDLKVWEYLDYFAHAYKIPETLVEERISQVIADTGLEVKRDAMIRGLSRGMKQRLGIARAIIHRPAVLILDEPASGLDPKARLELRNLLLSLRNEGTTILISSHILTELEGFCTSIGIMEKGKLVRSGRIDEITAAEHSGRVIELRWLQNSNASPNELLQKHPRVSEFHFEGTQGRFQFSGSENELAEIVFTLTSAGVRLVAVQENRYTVEDLYMKIARHEVM